MVGSDSHDVIVENGRCLCDEKACMMTGDIDVWARPPVPPRPFLSGKPGWVQSSA